VVAEGDKWLGLGVVPFIRKTKYNQDNAALNEN